MINYGYAIKLKDEASKGMRTLVQLADNLKKKSNITINVKLSGSSVSGMQNLSKLVGGLNSQVNNLSKSFDNLRRAQEKASTSGSRLFKGINQDMRGSGSSMSSIMGGIKQIAAAYAVSSGARQMWKAGTSEQDLVTRMGFFLRDKEAASNINQQLNTMAKTAPVDLLQLREQAQLMAPIFGKDVMKHLKNVATVTAATGGDFGNIAYNYGQIKSMGRTYGLDIRQFAMQNIPIYEEIGKVMKVPASAVQELGTQGKITFKVVQKAFENMTAPGGRFEGALGITAGTASGKAQLMMNDLYMKFSEGFQKMLPSIISLMDSLSPLFDGIPKIIQILTPMVDSLSKIVVALSPTITGLLEELVKMLVPIVNAINKYILAPIGGLPMTADVSIPGITTAIGRYAMDSGMLPYGADIAKQMRLSRVEGFKKDLANKTPYNTLVPFFNPLDPMGKSFPYGKASGDIKSSASTIASTNQDLAAAGVKGTGGIKNFKIEINAPIVQLNGVMGAKNYSPKETAEIAANEFLQIFQSVALN